MFSNCYALNSIKLAYTGSFNRNDYAFEDWHYNVSAAGTFYYNGSDTTRGTSAIQLDNSDLLTFDIEDTIT